MPGEVTIVDARRVLNTEQGGTVREVLMVVYETSPGQRFLITMQNPDANADEIFNAIQAQEQSRVSLIGQKRMY